jgi:hypothetical protein
LPIGKRLDSAWLPATKVVHLKSAALFLQADAHQLYSILELSVIHLYIGNQESDIKARFLVILDIFNTDKQL